MSVAIFKDEQTDEKALRNKKMLDSFPNTFKDYWYLQGPISLNFINKTLKPGSDNN